MSPQSVSAAPTSEAGPLHPPMYLSGPPCYEHAADCFAVKTYLHSNGITVEGDWTAVWNALLRCKERIDGIGEPCISVTLRINSSVTHNCN